MSRPIFNAITSEGGLLPADFLQSLLAPKPTVDGLKPADYHLDPNDRLNDVIAGAWNKLRSRWQTFRTKINGRPAGESTTSETRELWLQPLLGELGFGRVPVVRGLSFGDRTFDISHQWDSIPLHLVGTHVDLDQRTPGATGASRGSPHSIVQQLLNADPQRLWGVVSNGWQLRLLRDNAALTRQAYIEFDLQSIFDGDLYPEFVVLWLVLHQSRFEAREGQHSRCWLEMWRQAADQKGLRALEHLRYGVESAITSLGAGLLSNPHNGPLREALSSGQLTTQALYQQILRTVYRMIFLFVAEDRGLLHPRDPSEEAIRARARYAAHYSLSRLRELQLSRAGTSHPDLWIVFQLVTRKLGAEGASELALPILGSFLWSAGATKDLNGCLISNRQFLEAVQALAFTQEEGGMRRMVDYRNLGAEELGSVYEGLLELHVDVDPAAQSFTLKTAAGNERKTTGSYYTPDSLVQCLLDSALEPVVAEAARGKKGEAAAKALLGLKICDPAVGSGHFLIAAGHRLAKRVAAVRTGEDEPSPEATRTALRDVIGHCLYGVDINPMSAELCRVSLWLEALEPGKPLSFLDHHIQCGNSLLGATPRAIAEGLPDDAFKPITGDDLDVCKEAKRRNKDERQQLALFHGTETAPWQHLGNLPAAMLAVGTMSDDTAAELHQKEQRYAELVRSTPYDNARFLADAWCAAFVWKKTRAFPYPITNDVLRKIERNPQDCAPWMREEVERLRHSYQFFHWHLAFPEVFPLPGKGERAANTDAGWSGGFDIVLGNPPWEKIHLRDEEFFAQRHPEIADATTKAQRKRMIEDLRLTDPALFVEYERERDEHEHVSAFFRYSGYFPMTGVSRINLYSVFCETALRLVGRQGRFGLALASGLLTDENNKEIFERMVTGNQLVSAWDFENSKAIFPGVHRSYKFALVCCGGTEARILQADFAFYLTAIEELADTSRHFTLSPEDLTLLNPNTKACPTFRWKRDAEMALEIYKHVPAICSLSGREGEWPGIIKTPFNSANDSPLFEDVSALVEKGAKFDEARVAKIGDEVWLPIYEPKFIHQFNHRFATIDIATEKVAEVEQLQIGAPSYSINSRFWLKRALLHQRFPGRWFLLIRNITGALNERTAIATIIPERPCVDANLMLGVSAEGAALLTANMNAYVYDYLARQKIAGVHFNQFIWKQLPLVSPTAAKTRLGERFLTDWLVPRVLELIYTAWDLEPFARDCGWSGPPFVWDEARRFQLRCELDAAFFHLYALSRDDTAYILDTFPIVRRKDEARTEVTNAAREVVTPGRYVTKDTILEIYDALAESIRTGTPYQTRLDPPPADPRCCHPPRV